MAQLGNSNLTVGWFASIPLSRARYLSGLRQFHGIEVLDEGEGERVWLRGPDLKEEILYSLKGVLDCHLYTPHGDGQIVPHDKTIPKGYEPKGQWTSVGSWLTTLPPRSRFPIKTVVGVKLNLVRGGHQKPPKLAILSHADWLSYANSAPKVRLDRLAFAACRKGILVIGEPLPSLRGKYFWESDGIAVPIGFSWRPAVGSSVLRSLFGLADGDIALLLPKNGCTIIRNDQFVGASRSAARLTERGLRVES